MLGIFLDTAYQSLILLPLVIGIYISYKLMNITDLTVEGSYVLGAAVFSKLLINGYHPFMCTSVGIMAGVISGFIVGYIQKDDKVDPLIAGILMIFMMYSVNLQIMDAPNLHVHNLVTFPEIFDSIYPNHGDTILILISAFFSVIVSILIIKSVFGLKLRSYGINKALLYRLGNNPEKYRFLGLGLSNGLAALSGITTVQIYGFADVNMGFGIALISIAALLIGMHVTKKMFANNIYSVTKDIFACFVGILLYHLAVAIFLKIGINPMNLKLLIGLFLILLMKIFTSSRKGV
ncbi:MAG: putative ABC transport system permease protein [Candidatus Midichloriaceae bacterium]|jgi:putative ABC transport system permease protein